MGPVSLDWYKTRGLTETTKHIAEHDCMFYNRGDTYTTTKITAHYSCGRIDINNGDEIGVPPMRSEDWQSFSDWLDDVETMSVWSLDNLITAYQNQTGKTIHWDTYERKN